MRQNCIFSLLGALALGTLLLIGCVSFNDKAGKLLVTTAKTTDTAMQGWATYAVLTSAPKTQEDKVRDAYLRYQASMALATNAYAALVTSNDTNAWASASRAITLSSGSLLNLITLFSVTSATNR